jgi:hypothetical protein
MFRLNYRGIKKTGATYLGVSEPEAGEREPEIGSVTAAKKIMRNCKKLADI